MRAVAQKVIGLCAKDLIWCSETKYHSSCYKAFVRIQYNTGNTREDESSNDYDMTCNLRMMQFIDLIANPRKWSSKKSGNYFLTWQEKLGISVPDSHSKNLMPKMSK